MALVGFVGLCLLVGLAGGAICVRQLHTWFASLHAPPGTPPSWLFALIWSLLYVAVGVAGWMVWQRNGASRPLRLWGWQLAANAMWVPAFFGLHRPLLALAVILLLLVMIGMTARTFWRIRRSAAWLMVPYMAWSCYAAYLNAGFWLLNRT